MLLNNKYKTLKKPQYIVWMKENQKDILWKKERKLYSLHKKYACYAYFFYCFLPKNIAFDEKLP